MSEELSESVSNLSIEQNTEAAPVENTEVAQEESVGAPVENSEAADVVPEIPKIEEAPAPVEQKKRFPSFGGGGVKCTVCAKTSYPAETINFEQSPYHIQCFSCILCKKKLEMYNAAKFEQSIYCKTCFAREGLNKKQLESKWTGASSTGHSRTSSSLGGGGVECAKCAKTAYPAETISFESKPYHIKCFNCTLCKKDIDATNAAKFEDNIFCRTCFLKEGYNEKQRQTSWSGAKSTTSTTSSLYGGGGVKCAVCDKTAYPAETISFESRPYHIKCFSCQLCKKDMDATNAAKFEEQIFCRTCFLKEGYNEKQRQTHWSGAKATTTPASTLYGGGGAKCTVCEKTAYPAETISFESKPYHTKCFSCVSCKKDLDAPSAAKFEEKIYCRTCFQKEGLHIKQVSKSSWEAKTTTTPTNPHAFKFGGGGTPCQVCTKTVYAGEAVKFENKIYHPKCFACGDCNRETKVADAAQFEGRIICKGCWTKGGYATKQLTSVRTTSN